MRMFSILLFLQGRCRLCACGEFDTFGDETSLDSLMSTSVLYLICKCSSLVRVHGVCGARGARNSKDAEWLRNGARLTGGVDSGEGLVVFLKAHGVTGVFISEQQLISAFGFSGHTCLAFKVSSGTLFCALGTESCSSATTRSNDVSMPKLASHWSLYFLLGVATIASLLIGTNPRRCGDDMSSFSNADSSWFRSVRAPVFRLEVWKSFSFPCLSLLLF